MPPPNIVPGGEQIPNNTYGFEIEFCSHDNSVFAFTHVETALITVTFAEGGRTEVWHIETDSGNVLELVTPPLRFPDIATAVAYKQALAATLVQSVYPACTYEDWMQNRIVPLVARIRQYYGDAPAIESAFTTAAVIAPQINVENVDDGINIMAGYTRLQINAADWNPYVGATILTHSEKDWLSGYSSQVNMPMTAEGYLYYCTSKKLTKSQQRFEVMVENPGLLADCSTSKLEKDMNTWFWRNVIFTAFVMYAVRNWGPEVIPHIRYLVPVIPQDFIRNLVRLPMSEEDLVVDGDTFREVISLMENLNTVAPVEPAPDQLKHLAVLYITVGKMLSGALGSLSERNQLQLQDWAWQSGSTEVMAPQNEADELMAQRRWLEYHSSMKDLTGLWFKAALMDVMAREGVCIPLRNNSTFHENHAYLPAGWAGILGTYVSLMRSERWNEGRIYTDDLRDLHFQTLAQHITWVEDQFNNSVIAWGNVPPAFNLPPRVQRPFLHYGNPELPGSLWEGRYDTMIPAIDPHDGVGWTYLVEHRFN